MLAPPRLSGSESSKDPKTCHNCLPTGEMFKTESRGHAKRLTGDIVKQYLDWNPQGNRRAKSTLRRTIAEDAWLFQKNGNRRGTGRKVNAWDSQ